MQNSLVKYGDGHQYEAQPIQEQAVHLLNMTDDPLGVVAAFSKIYEGAAITDLSRITDGEREKYFEDILKTKLDTPLEAVKLHFVLEGVSRSFTHQLVRQRTAVYGQESMRFAVKSDMANEVPTPPFIAALGKNDDRRVTWENAILNISNAYNFLVSNGVPAEEARGLAPHGILTRVHYVTDLRNLARVAGDRLCTQAQFEWRLVFLRIIKAIAEYTPDFSWIADIRAREHVEDEWEDSSRWQFQEIAQSSLFRPACYQVGHCPFNASFDRSCTIRERVEFFSKNGVPSSEWDEPVEIGNQLFPHSGIDPKEWLLDPAAARLQ